MTGAPVFRFAPSPNGPLHLGHAYSALIGFDLARRTGGRFLLRVEDIDLARCSEQFVAALYEDLAWLGIVWEQPVLHQSQHFADYSGAARHLLAQGLLYPCFASRSEIWAADGDLPLDPDGAPLYPGLHKNLPGPEIEARIANGQPFALRIDMERALVVAQEKLGDRRLAFTELDERASPTLVEAYPERWGDAVILRKDVPASYHLAVVIDDARQGVTHVTRGRDLYAATDIHRLLQVLLDLPEPLYHHHPLIGDENGRKLAKSEASTGLAELRAAGVTPREIRARLGLG
jgi:glutamyl-Q tRNA(Asp) synthetase